jgi:hypothetical protein
MHIRIQTVAVLVQDHVHAAALGLRQNACLVAKIKSNDRLCVPYKGVHITTGSSKGHGGVPQHKGKGASPFEKLFLPPNAFEKKKNAFEHAGTQPQEQASSEAPTPEKA